MRACILKYMRDVCCLELKENDSKEVVSPKMNLSQLNHLEVGHSKEDGTKALRPGS